MAPATSRGVTLRNVCSASLTVFSAVQIVITLRDPDALRFFGFWIAVAAVVGAVGSLVALLIVALRRLAEGPAGR